MNLEQKLCSPHLLAVYTLLSVCERLNYIVYLVLNLMHTHSFMGLCTLSHNEV